MRPDGLHVQRVLELRVVLAEHVGQAVPASGAGGSGASSEAAWKARSARCASRRSSSADAQVLGQLGVAWASGPSCWVRSARGLADLQPQLLRRALDVHLPALVAEVPLDLAGDARLGVGGQAAADGRVEVVDGLQQADVADLHQLLGRLRAVPVPLGAGPDQRSVTADQHLAGGVALCAAPRQRLDQLHQFRVAEVGGLADGGLRAGKDGGHWRSPAAFLVCTFRSCPLCGV